MRHEWGGMHARRDEHRKAHAQYPAAKQHAKAGAQAAKERTTRASKPRTLLAQSFRRETSYQFTSPKICISFFPPMVRLQKEKGCGVNKLHCKRRIVQGDNIITLR